MDMYAERKEENSDLRELMGLKPASWLLKKADRGGGLDLTDVNTMPTARQIRLTNSVNSS